MAIYMLHTITRFARYGYIAREKIEMLDIVIDFSPKSSTKTCILFAI